MTFTQVEFKARDWVAFCEYVAEAKDAIFTAPAEKAFCDNFVVASGSISDRTKVWMRVFRDKVTEALNFTVCICNTNINNL